MSTPPKTTYILNETPTKISMSFFREIKQKKIIIFVWNHETSRIAKAILRKTDEAGGITVPDFKLYYRAKIRKTA